MVVVLIALHDVTVEPIKIMQSAVSRLCVGVDRESIQRPSDWQLCSKNAGEMGRGEVIVVVVRSASMSAKVVEFAGKIRVGVAVLFDRIENGHAVGGDGNRTAEQRFLGGHGAVSESGLQGKPKRIAPDVGLGKRNLAIPSLDPDHHPVPWHAAALHVEILLVPSHMDTPGERTKRTRHHLGIETESPPCRISGSQSG